MLLKTSCFKFNRYFMFTLVFSDELKHNGKGSKYFTGYTNSVIRPFTSNKWINYFDDDGKNVF